MKVLSQNLFRIVLVAAVVLVTLVSSDVNARRTQKVVISEEDAARIKGKIIRPEMELILQRSRMNYDALKLKESFLPRIVRSVNQELF